MPIVLTERQTLLIRWIQKLDKSQRHVVKVYCRGDEPWEVELVKKEKFVLRPK